MASTTHQKQTTAHTNPPHVHSDVVSPIDKSKAGRKYGIILGVLTAVYLIILNLTAGEGTGPGGNLPLGLRFAKHLLIIPIVWFAVASYAKTLPEGRVFKNEIGLLGSIAAWSAGTVALANILFFAFTSISFEQFMQEGETLMGVMINSGFLIFETVVFVMIVGFVILQAYKGKGSPED